jgi:hypothetical protein
MIEQPDKTAMYFITTVCKDFDHQTMRCVGYYQNFDYAKDTLVTNQLDINETIYNYAMIEKIRNGLYADDIIRWWFKFDYEKGIYEECETPEQYKNNPFPFSLR